MIARLSGVVLPSDKRIEIALTYIFGIGKSKSINILNEANIDSNKRTKDLTDEEINTIRTVVEKEKVEGDLKREIIGNIKRLKEMRSYRGLRHIKGLPARGQRTKTNSRTVRGNIRKTAGSGKKGAAQKT